MHHLDPAVLPAVQGTIDRFLRNRRGEVDGVLLDAGRQVHVPPHMGAALERKFSPGDRLEARYVKPRGADVYAAVSVTNRAGDTIIDQGPPPKHGPPAKKAHPVTRPVTLSGKVMQTLYAPKGEVSGAVLDTGEQLRVDPKENAELAPYFRIGAEVRVWGESVERKGTVVVDVAEIGFSKDFD
jgi:hypothetical protein